MTDIVELLREVDISWSEEGELISEAADEIEGTRNELAACKQELEVEEARFSAQCEILAASQAREKVLRETMERIIGLHNAPNDCYSTGPLHGDFRDASCPSCEGEALLAQPTDDTALRDLLKAERERCADIAESYTGKQGEHDGTAIAIAIRELGD